MDIPTGTIARTTTPAHRIVGLVLAGVSAFAVTLAVLLHSYVLPRFARLPLDPNLSLVTRGPGSYVDPLTRKQVSGNLVRTARVGGDPAAGSASVAVWDVSTQLADAERDLLGSSAERVALDRTTAEAVDCCGATTQHSGLTYAFPAGASRRSYLLYDPVVDKAFPARFEARDTVRGLHVYRYVSRVQGQHVAASAFPLAAGNDPRGVMVYDAGRTLWVEPRSGVIVRELLHQHAEPSDSAGPDRVGFDAVLESSPSTVATSVRSAEARARQLWLTGVVGPIVALVIAVIAAVAATVTTRRSRWAVSRQDFRT